MSMDVQTQMTAYGRQGATGVFKGELVGRFGSPWAALTDGATVPVVSSLGSLFALTCASNAAREIQVPVPITFPIDGQVLLVVIFNTSGGALTQTTFAAAIKQPTLTFPADGTNRSYVLRLGPDGVTWSIVGDSGADCPN